MPRPVTIASVLLAAAVVATVFAYGHAHQGALSPRAVAHTIRPAQLDSPAPPFHATTLTGKQIRGSTYTGRPMVINFFASWCPPCQQDAPRIAALIDSYKGRIAVLGVDGNDTQSGARKFVAKYRWRFPILWDPGDHLFTTFGIAAQPVTLIVDAHGAIRDRFLGPIDLTQARHILNRLLA